VDGCHGPARDVNACLPSPWRRSRPTAAANGLGYLSTTGVYGIRPGGLGLARAVILRPGSAGSQARASPAKQLWLGSGLPGQGCFPACAILWPGRTPFPKLRDGSSRISIKTGQVVQPAIHVRMTIAFQPAVLPPITAAQAPGVCLNPGPMTEPCFIEPDPGLNAATLRGLQVPLVESSNSCCASSSPNGPGSFWADQSPASATAG